MIKGFAPSTYNEWPGKIVAIIFMGGCNFRCGFCHNRDIVLNKTPDIEFSEILTKLKKRKKWVDAVEISGGEPSLHRSDVTKMLKELKKEGFLTMANTNGSDPNFIKRSKKLVDYWAMDVKAPFDKYDKVAGAKVDINKIKKSIKLIMSSKDYEFRTTVVPGLHNKNDILEIAKSIKGAKRYFIQNFVPHNTLDPEYMKKLPFSEKQLKDFVKIVKPYVKEVQVR